jgi:hypothetical protein
MLRPVLTEVALFLAPFAIYIAFLLATRAEVFDREVWSWRIVAWLTIAALLCVVASFIVMAHFYGAPPGSTYVPAHMEDGRLVPGRTVPGKTP